MVDLLTWFFSPELGRDKLALLILCSGAMYVLATNLAWRLQPGRSWFTRLVTQLMRLLYYLGIPSVLLWRGTLVAQMGIPTTYVGEGGLDLAVQFIGLGDAEHLVQVGRGVAWTAGGLGALVVLWVWYAHAVPGTRVPSPSIPWWVACREALFYQAHWAFYRAVVSLFTTSRLNIAFASLAMVALLWFSAPQRRHDLFTLHGYRVVEDWVCALFTSLLSLSVSLPWLFVIAHMLWLWIGGRTLARALAVGTGRSIQPPLEELE